MIWRTDEDGLLDIGDPCPNDSDCDDDQFSDYIELYLGTDPVDACPDAITDDAWPPDMNNDTRANVLDVLLLAPHWGPG